MIRAHITHRLFAPGRPLSVCLVAEDREFNFPAAWLSKVCGGVLTPGRVVELEEVSENKWRAKPADPSVPLAGTPDQRLAWRTRDVAEHQLHKASLSLKGHDELLEKLSPLRDAMRKLPAPHRAQAMAKIVAYLTS